MEHASSLSIEIIFLLAKKDRAVIQDYSSDWY